MKGKQVLRIEHLHKSYPGVKALKGVDVSFNSGEVHGLIGENGAGKSTLIKILAGIVKSDSGSIFIKDKEVSIKSSKDSAAHGLSFIHQELNLVSYFNAMENIFLGHPYPRKFGPLVDWKLLEKQTKQIIDTLQVSFPLDIPVSYLSAVDRAMVTIARAFAVAGDVYLMDEPATALTNIEKEKLFSVIKNLKDQGKTIVYVSHNLDDVLQITDRVTVMRDGTVVECRKTSDMTKDSLISSMIGKDLKSAFPERIETVGEKLLSVSHLTNSHVHDISFELRAGEILGIGGLVGSGRTELLESIFGSRSLISGEMKLEETPFHPASPRDAIDRGVVLVPEEKRKQGLVLSRSIYENISLMSLSDLSTAGFLDHAAIQKRSTEAGKKVRLKNGNYKNHVSTLSGGNQQKVVLAKTVLQKPKILMLDEPSKGVDVGARFEIYTIIRELVASGTGVILVSSDFNEILGLADRILFIKDGNTTFVKENKNIHQEAYLNYCYGRKLS